MLNIKAMIVKLIECRVRVKLYEAFLEEIKDKKGCATIRTKYYQYLKREKNKVEGYMQMLNKAINEKQS
jgi:hypothetical protein